MSDDPGWESQRLSHLTPPRGCKRRKCSRSGHETLGDGMLQGWTIGIPHRKMASSFTAYSLDLMVMNPFMSKVSVLSCKVSLFKSSDTGLYSIKYLVLNFFFKVKTGIKVSSPETKTEGSKKHTHEAKRRE